MDKVLDQVKNELMVGRINIAKKYWYIEKKNRDLDRELFSFFLNIYPVSNVLLNLKKKVYFLQYTTEGNKEGSVWHSRDHWHKCCNIVLINS